MFLRYKSNKFQIRKPWIREDSDFKDGVILLNVVYRIYCRNIFYLVYITYDTY